MEREAAIFHNSRIPKSLIVDRKDFCSVDDNDDDDDEDEAEAARNEMERENARTFVERLGRHMEALLGARGAVEVDVRLQEFASKFCEGIASFKKERFVECRDGNKHGHIYIGRILHPVIEIVGKNGHATHPQRRRNLPIQLRRPAPEPQAFPRRPLQGAKVNIELLKHKMLV